MARGSRPRAPVARAARAVALLAALTAAAAAPAPAAVTATIDVSAPQRTVDPSFLGVNIDSASLTNRIDLTDPYLTTMGRQLGAAAGPGAPRMHMRVGGSASNGLIYLPDGTPGRGPHGGTVVTDASLGELNAFATAIGARLTFCIQYQTGADGRWDPANATALWARVAAANLTAFSGWSLGNEIIGGQGFNVAGYAADYVEFRAAVAADAPAWAQDVVGPSAAGWPGEPVMRTFLEAVAGAANVSLSMHAYSFGNCTLATYLEKAGIERMAYYYGVFAAARDAFAPALPLYVEECATQAGGGCDGLGNRFVSGFWFVHALGLAGRMGVARVTRQDLAGWSFTSGVSRYMLAGPPGWESTASGGLPTPHPDWYTAILWRQLVGDAVLAVSVDAAPEVNATLGLHAWCAAGVPGGVVVAYINLAPSPVALTLGGALPASPRVEYVMTAPGGNLTADGVLLNGVLLAVDGAGRLPAQPVPGAPVPAGAPGIVVPRYSYGFVVLGGAGAAACM